MSKTGEFFFLLFVLGSFALMTIAIVNAYRKPKEEC